MAKTYDKAIIFLFIIYKVFLLSNNLNAQIRPSILPEDSEYDNKEEYEKDSLIINQNSSIGILHHSECECIEIPETNFVDRIITKKYNLFCYPEGEYENSRIVEFIELVAWDLAFVTSDGYLIEEVEIIGNADGLSLKKIIKWENILHGCDGGKSGRISDADLALIRACTAEYYLSQIENTIGNQIINKLIPIKKKGIDIPDGGASGACYRFVTISITLTK